MNRRDFIRHSGMASLSIPFVGYFSENNKTIERSICVFSKLLQWLDYDELAEVVKAMGFDGIDLTVRQGGHVLPENIQTDLPKAANAIEKRGLTIPIVASSVNNADNKNTVTFLKALKDTGIKKYRMAYYRYEEGMSVPENLKLLTRRAQELADLNAKYSIHGAYQNHAGPLVGGPIWDIWYIIKDISPRWMGVQYDIRHATVEGGRSWPTTLNLIYPFINSMVIKDFKWEFENGNKRIRNVPFGEGMVDFDAYFQFVKEKNISGPITLQYEFPIMSEEEEATLSRTKKIDKTIEVMKNDLDKLKAMLTRHGLRP